MSSFKQHTYGNSKVDRSSVNHFLFGSTPSSELGINIHREVTEEHERKVVLEIVDRIFDDKTGLISISTSACTTPTNKSKERVYDKRLQYWKDMLDERKLIAEQIQRKTGKPTSDVLFQERSTYQDRDKQMVMRVLDYGSRLNPFTLVQKRVLQLKEFKELDTCLYNTEVRETLPKAEREESTKVEITGMPNITKREQLAHEMDPCKRSAWLETETLRNHVEQKREDIERVIEFYPDIEHLQVVGESILKGAVVKHDSTIELIQEEVIKDISSETEVKVEECKCEVKLVKIDEPIVYGLKINEHIYIANAKRSAQHVEVEARFECYPFENVVKRVMHLENIGQKVINIELVTRNYYSKVPQLLRTTDNEFLFDPSPFRLIAGEKRDIIVLYRPRKVDVVKQQWLLKIEPQFFCRKNDSIILKLSGRCKPPFEYADKINGTLRTVVEKSNMKMMRKLENNLGGLAPLIKPDEVICPYRRVLNERELFEQLNPGYSCERFHDLELLKDIHKRLKKPREPAWDLKIKSLDQFIMRLENPEDRALVFNEMLGILENMKGISIELAIKVEENPERARARFLYVRGTIATFIDEWEELALSIEETFVNQAIKIHHAANELKQEEEADQIVDPVADIVDSKAKDKVNRKGNGKASKKSVEKPVEKSNGKTNDKKNSKENDDKAVAKLDKKASVSKKTDDADAKSSPDEDENALRAFLTKKVRRQKPFRDTIYMQTYTLLCNFVEDIVSVIESTEVV